MEEGNDKTLALMSFIFALVSFMAMPFVMSLVAVITGKMALNRIRDEPETYGGKTFAQLGFWIGLVKMITQSVVLLMVLVIILVYMLIVGAAVLSS